MRDLEGFITDSHAKDLRDYCDKIEERMEFVGAGEKLARLDLDKRLYVVDLMDTTVK